MTVDELAHELEMLQAEGKGALQVVIHTSLFQFDVRTIGGLAPVTVRFADYGDHRRRYPVRTGQLADGRGRPAGTERAVFLL